MKLAEYVALERKTVDDFEAEFTRGQWEDDYPTDLDQADWEEQFLAFMAAREE